MPNNFVPVRKVTEEFKPVKMVTEEQIGVKCIMLWGEQDQIRQTVEECAELIVNLSKYGRNVNGSTKEQIAEEIADVEIMCKEMRIVFNNDLVDSFKIQKLARLNERVEKESQLKARDNSFKPKLLNQGN